MVVNFSQATRVAVVATLFGCLPACLPGEDCRDTATCPSEPDDASLPAADASRRGDAVADYSAIDAPVRNADAAAGDAQSIANEEADGGSGCVSGAVRKCADDSELHALGNCADGTETCVGTTWGPCNVKAQAKDACTPSDDANCNGTINDGCPCVVGAKQPCGPLVDVGECRRGTQTCAASTWGDCVGAVLAKPRDCTSGLDVDCDGFPDNKVDTICKCTVGVQQDCETHPGKDGKGPCHPGSQTCVAAADKKSSAFSSCAGSAGPAAADTCEIGNDNNCNGVVNEGCSCVNGSTQACGPATSVGVCKPGVQTCVGSAWGACTAVFATGRDCTKATDNDCNGTPDQSDTTCECVAGTTRACTTTLLGPCKPGTQTCVSATDKKSTSWGNCIGTVTKAAKDLCDPGNDANCSGIANEGCACVNGTTRPCGTDAGNCVAGTQTCVNSAWSATCVGEVKAGLRDCTRAGDYDCVNGEDQLETACTTPCRFNATLAGCATALPGSCARGTQTCVASANKTSVAWGSCVAPSAAANDGCNPPNDANCNGKVGEGCCVPKTVCTAAQCGIVSNGCGGTINCGTSCPGIGQSCGAGGTANVCGCIDNDDACAGKRCGTVTNNCGHAITCQPNVCIASAETIATCQVNQCVVACAPDTTPLSCSESAAPACGRWRFESSDSAREWAALPPFEFSGQTQAVSGNLFVSNAAQAFSGNGALGIPFSSDGSGNIMVGVGLCPRASVVTANLNGKHLTAHVKLVANTGDTAATSTTLQMFPMNDLGPNNLVGTAATETNYAFGTWQTLDVVVADERPMHIIIISAQLFAATSGTMYIDDLWIR